MADRGAPLPRYFLSFDCATKTFAFCLCRFDAAAVAQALAGLFRRLRLLRRLAAAARAGNLDQSQWGRVLGAAAALADETRGLVEFIDGETVDLCPGRADAELGSAERLGALGRYCAGRVRGALAAGVPAGERVGALVEHQPGSNGAARAVESALLALFHDLETAVVNPSLKCRVSPRLPHSHFAARYASAYLANKAHALHSFEALLSRFSTKIAPQPRALLGHTADAAMQIFGLVCLGPSWAAARALY